MIVVEIEDMIANTIIEQIKQNGNRCVSLKQAEEYGQAVVDKLKELGKDAILSSIDSHIVLFEKKYSNYFFRTEIDGELGYELSADKTVDDLVLKFRRFLPGYIISVFEDEDIVNDILLDNENKTKVK